MRYVAKADLDKDLEYFQRIYLLSRLAGLCPDEIVENWGREPRPSFEQVERDLQALEHTIQEGRLPTAYRRSFEDVVGFRNQLESAGIYPEEQQFEPFSVGEEVSERVEAELSTDAKLGHPTDLTVEIFYRIWHSHFREN